MSDISNARDAESVCPGSGLRGAPKRRFDGGFWRPCSVCGRRFLPKYGGVMPEHKRLIDGPGPISGGTSD